VIDGKTKKVLFTFEQERRSGANSESGFHIGPLQSEARIPTLVSSIEARSRLAVISPAP
jgi:hypothetical protein